MRRNNCGRNLHPDLNRKLGFDGIIEADEKGRELGGKIKRDDKKGKEGE